MITVHPEAFTKVEYDPAEIAALAQESLELVSGVPDDLDVEVHVDERAATTTFAIASLDPVVVHVDGGAVENHRDPRRLGTLETRITFARLFLELYDRRSPWFRGPGLDDEVSLAHRVAWNVNLYGRVAQLGLRLHKPRFVYDFRNRHGFTDHGDTAFEALWSAGETTWARIVELSDEASAVPSD